MSVRTTSSTIPVAAKDSAPAKQSPSPRRPSPAAARAKVDPALLLDALVNSSDDAIITTAPDGTILTWNPAAERLFGYPAEEIVGRSTLTLVPSELHPRENEILQSLINSGGIVRNDTVRLRKNGEQFAASVACSPVCDRSGKFVAISHIMRDIGYLRRNDESRFRLAAIVDSADDAIVGKNLNGIVTSWNEGARRMFGYAENEMVGQSIRRIIPDELQYEEDEILRKIRAGQRIEHFETVRRKKDGQRLDVSVTISPIRDESGAVIGASKIARDISDKRRTERLLLQSEKLAATGRMAAAVAHEINNPLESIINLVFLARQKSPPGSRSFDLLATAEEELERVSHIARQTLGYYRDTGSPIDLHIHELIENVLVVYKGKLLSTGIGVDSRFDDLQKICVSRGEMLQVFSNIIANAIDAMPHGGVLKICTRQLVNESGDGIQVTIQDSGRGINPENLARLFEPFFTTKGTLGTGIGLWIVKELMERRAGQISIASSIAPKESGTTVTLFLPFSWPQRPSEKSSAGRK